MKTKLIAWAWLILGTGISSLLVRDLMRFGDGFQRAHEAIFLALLLIAFCMACFSLSYGLFTGRGFSSRLGLALSLVFGLLLLAYVALNLFLLLKFGSLVSLLAVAGGLLGIGFCWLTAKVSAMTDVRR
jgi:hypothetical protein